jgi:hypothetical protein
MTTLVFALLLWATPSGGPTCALTLGDDELICDSLAIDQGRDGPTGFTARSGRNHWRFAADCQSQTTCQITEVSRDGAAAKASGACRLELSGAEVKQLDCRSYSAFGEVQMRMWPAR